MTASTEQQRAARRAIADVLVRYASGIDGRDWALFRCCFTEGCEADDSDIGTWRGADDLTDAAARSYVDALVLGPGNESVYRVAGYYDDELVRAADGWRIARRRFTLVHQEVGAG